MCKRIRYYRLRPGQGVSFYYRLLMRHLRRTRRVPKFSQCSAEAAQLAARLSILSFEIGTAVAYLVLCENYKINIALCGEQDKTAQNELGLPFKTFVVPGWRATHGAPIDDLLERE